MIFDQNCDFQQKFSVLTKLYGFLLLLIDSFIFDIFYDLFFSFFLDQNLYFLPNFVIFFIPNQNNIGDEYNIKIIPDESILLPETISLNLYEINNHNSYSFPINETNEYIHMFTGTIINKSSKIQIEVKSESDTFTGTLSNLGKWEYFGKTRKKTGDADF